MKLSKFKHMSEDKLAGRSRSSVGRDILFRGFPAPIKIGGSIFFDVDAVERWIQQQAEIPYAPTPVAIPKEGKRRGRKCKNFEGIKNENQEQ
jgi:predicted DNA-binding transcriptional regulator AlpA